MLLPRKLYGGEMPKEFKCKDLGMQCNFSARAESEEEVVRKAVEHAQSAHKMPASEETKKKIRAATKTSR